TWLQVFRDSPVSLPNYPKLVVPKPWKVENPREITGRIQLSSNPGFYVETCLQLHIDRFAPTFNSLAMTTPKMSRARQIVVCANPTARAISMTSRAARGPHLNTSCNHSIVSSSFDAVCSFRSAPPGERLTRSRSQTLQESEPAWTSFRILRFVR